jgi:hypothetical protein
MSLFSLILLVVSHLQIIIGARLFLQVHKIWVITRYTVTVRGAIVDGTARIGTAFIP